MKKIFIMPLLLITGISCAYANWWEMQTICRKDPSTCYTSMGIGYDRAWWDDTSECWGQKIICGTALTPVSDENAPKTKKQILARTGINPDFDTDILNGDCFGVRKTISNGSQAYYNDKLVNVFCPGILENIYPDNQIEIVATGSILARASQPQCNELSEYGYIGTVKNGNCYGKYYSESEYYIDCSGGGARLIILNGAADYNTDGDYPTTMADAEDIFEHMINISANQRTNE